MATSDILSVLYSKEKSPLEFNFDSLWFQPLYTILPPQVIEQLRQIATSIKLSSKIKQKYAMIKSLVEPYGFKLFHAGTNRVVYRHLEFTNIVLKIAVDSVGMSNNPMEFKNQMFLKPFVSKTFEVSPCGTVAIAERVEPITSVAEFTSIGEDVFELITNNIVGEYVLEDIGTKFFRNWGLRKGLGPVLLDYPYMFKLDGNKLYCNKEDPITGELCNGVIDYDEGFNFLRCTKCGKMHEAKHLQRDLEENKLILKSEELDNMIVKLVRGNKTIHSNEINETSTTRRTSRNSRNEQRSNGSNLVVTLTRGGRDFNNISNVKDEFIYKQEQPTFTKEKVQLTRGNNRPERFDTISRFIKNGEQKQIMKHTVKPEVKVEKEEIQITEDLAEKLKNSMANGLGVTEEDFSKFENKKVEEHEEEVEKDPIKEKYSEYKSSDDYESREKIKKTILENF